MTTLRLYRLVIGALAAISLLAPVGGLAAQAPAAGVTAFVDVAVIPMDRERVLPGQTVLVRDGRIAEVGAAAAVRVPEGATVIQGGGRYLIPGLTEMHAHIPPPQAGEAVIDRTLFLYLAGGVTTVRGMLGHPRHLELREAAAAGELLAPRIYTSGPSFNGNSAPSPEVAVPMVEEQKAAGYDLLKLHPGLSRETFDAIAAAADRVGIPFAGHVSGDVGLERALEAGYASIDHLDGYVEALAGRAGGFDPQSSGFFGFGFIDEADPARIEELVARTREAGVWNVPTQTLMENIMSAEDPERMAERPEMRFVAPQTLRQWIQQTRNIRGQEGYTRERADRYIKLRRELLRALHEGGAGIALGSDAPQLWNVPGFSARRELELMVAAGLSEYDALRTGTAAAAAYFDDSDEWGTIQVGRAADLVLLEADPLQNIRNLWRQAGVMVGGRWLPQTEIERRLDEIAREVQG